MTTDLSIARVAVISSGPPMSQKILYCLRKIGLRADLVDVGATCSMARYSRYRHGYARYSSDPMDGRHEGFADFLRLYIAKNKIDAVIAADIESSAMLYEVKSLVGDVFVFPVSGADTLELLDNKWKFQVFMEKHGIPSPRTAIVDNEEDVRHALSGGINFPVIVKPLYGEASHGVEKLNDYDQLVNYIHSGAKYAKFPLLVQQFVSGYDADLSVLAIDGTVVAHVLQSRRDPRALEFIESEVVLEIGRAIVGCSGYSGVANIDVRIDEKSNSVTVLECNPRFWYTLPASLWRGLNFVEEGLRAARGLPVEIETVVGGKYYRHKDLLESVLWRPTRWSEIRSYNLCGLFQVLSDPAPFLFSSGR